MVSARVAAVALVALAGAVPVAAGAAEGGQWHVGVSGGTLGISPEVGYRFGSHTGLRVNGGFLDYDRSEEIDDIDYDGTLKLNSVGLMADFYPFGGSFRLSVGARSNSNKIDLVATPTTDVEIGDVSYSPDQVGQLAGGVKFRKFTPALTLGWGGKLGKGFTMGLEAGVLLQGSPKFSLAASGGLLANDDEFLEELEKERAQAEEDAEDFKLWPVIQIHFAWRF
jgi:hypothetical protein